MTGLLLLLVVGLWAWACVAIVRTAGLYTTKSRWRIPVKIFVLSVALVLPIADEIVGGIQFESLCRQYAVQTIDEQHAPNARVVSIGGRKDWSAPSTAVPIRIQPWIYQDTTTQKVVVSYHTVHAKGGWFIRTLGISETNSPLLFRRGCGPNDPDAFKKKFNITVVN